jgi:hypothetical protein
MKLTSHAKKGSVAKKAYIKRGQVQFGSIFSYLNVRNEPDPFFILFVLQARSWCECIIDEIQRAPELFNPGVERESVLSEDVCLWLKN